MLHRTVASMCAALALFFTAASARSASPSATLTAKATTEVAPPVKAIRLEMMLFAEGPSIPAALKRLQSVGSQVRTRLAKLGFDEKTVDIGEPTIATPLFSSGRLLEPQPADGPLPSALSPPSISPETQVVGANLRAEFATGDLCGAEALARCAELQRQVKEAKLDSLHEIASQRQCQACGDPGVPRLLFVVRLSDAELQAAEKTCFAKARSQADRLARSAGARVTSLVSLDERVVADNPFAMPAPSPGHESLQLAGGASAETGDVQASVTESAGPDPSQMRFRVTVSAAFAIEVQ